MISRENTVILGFGVAALVSMYGVFLFTDLPDWAGIAVLLIVGVIAPQLLNNYLDETDR